MFLYFYNTKIIFSYNFFIKFSEVPLDLIKNKLAALSSLVTEITSTKSDDFDFIEKNLKSLNHNIKNKFPIQNVEDLNDIENRIKTCPDSRATLVYI